MGFIQSCHDLADGGLAVGLAECCVMDWSQSRGLKATLESDLPDYVLAFSESQSRFIVSIAPEDRTKFENHFLKSNIPCVKLGEVGGNSFSLNDFFDFPLEKLKEIYYSTISSIMNQQF